MSVPVGVTIIAICMLILTVGTVLATGAIIWLIRGFKKMVGNKVDEAMAKVQPIVDQAQTIANQVGDTTEKLTSAVNTIASKAEETANTVGDKVKIMSEKVEDAVNPQVVTIAGMVGTAARCVQIYHDLVKLREEPKESKISDENKT
jgi:methyl-accepting chemotaxis protein